MHIQAPNETKIDKDISDRILEIDMYIFVDRNRNGEVSQFIILQDQQGLRVFNFGNVID